MMASSSPGANQTKRFVIRGFGGLRCPSGAVGIGRSASAVVPSRLGSTKLESNKALNQKDTIGNGLWILGQAN